MKSLLADNMLIQSDIKSPNALKDNLLYYITGFIVNQPLTKLECVNCRSELMLAMEDRCAFQMYAHPAYAKFSRA